MSTAHNIDILNCYEIWTKIKDFHNKTEEIQKKKKGSLEKVKRSKYLDYWGPRLKAAKEDTANKFNLIYSRKRN